MLSAFITKFNSKRKLIEAFEAGSIYISKKTSGKELKRYPIIHEVNVQDKFTRYTFTIPNGFDPKEVRKRDYTFKQIFGPNVELKGEVKKFVLLVYQSSMPDIFKYDYRSIKEQIKTIKLPIICGADRYNNLVYYDMVEIPHILIGGATGSGKSTQLRQLLTTLILAKSPEELELYLADCKKAEFHIFRNVEHVKANVVQAKHIERMITSIIEEMDKRSDLLDVFNVAHIDDVPAEHRKSYIVLCIDEFVMLRKEKGIMENLIELTALGRALGIFVILSMQRPVKDVLDTTIRSNLNVAMGFKVRDKIESRILNTPGAEEITVKGRFYMDNNGDMTEVQSPLLTIEEAKKLLEPFKVAPKEAKEVYDSPVVENEVLTYDDVFGEEEE